MLFRTEPENVKGNNRSVVIFLTVAQPFNHLEEFDMNSIIWWVGFIVILLAVLSFVGLR